MLTLWLMNIWKKITCKFSDTGAPQKNKAITNIQVASL